MALRNVCTKAASRQSAAQLTNVMARLMSTTRAAPAKIGFIGLGNMGGHMVANLLKQGHELNVFDISAEAGKAAAAKGAKVVATTQDVARDADFVITMLPNNDIVTRTYETIAEKGAISAKTVFIDSSTIDPNVAKNVQRLIAGKGARFVDAPVSGGVPGAEQATLTFMVGGTEAEFAAIKPTLEAMGKRITHCGDYGMGQAAKICNNMLLGISMIGVCETMNMAIRLGLDAKQFMDIVNSSTGRCWSSEVYNPVPGLVATAPCNNDYAGGFSTDLITKDLGLASAVATASNSPIPLGSMAHQVYRTLKAKGLGGKDFSVVYEFLKNEKNN